MALAQNVHQWNKIEDPNMNTCNSRHLIFDKGSKNIHWRKDNLQELLLGTGYPHAEERNDTHMYNPALSIEKKVDKRLQFETRITKMVRRKH